MGDLCNNIYICSMLVNHAHILLRTIWLAMALLAISSRWLVLVDRLASHGKLIRPSSTSHEKPTLQDKILRLRVPKQLFAHFYVVASVWPLCLMGEMVRYKSPTRSALLCMVLLELHGLRRLYESLWVFRYGDAQMHIVAYIVGIAHYLLAGLSLALDPACYKPADRASIASVAIAALFGTAIFIVGSYHQAVCHRILGSLRDTSEAVASCQHKVPQGDWFDLVSCPHYLGESLAYLGLFVAGGMVNWTALSMWVWVFVNLGITAQKTRKWYREKFDDYPAERCAMVPGLW